MKSSSIVKKRQQPLRESYLTDPKSAQVTDIAIVEGKDLEDPFHSEVSINDELRIPFKIGLHRAVGGLHDFPNPGDLLCASLAVCFETTLRMISNRLDISLKKTKVQASAMVDVRGTLMLARNVPVGFQSMVLDVEIEVESSVHETTVSRLLGATEQCCIIYQTLKPSFPIRLIKKVTYTNGNDK